MKGYKNAADRGVLQRTPDFSPIYSPAECGVTERTTALHVGLKSLALSGHHRVGVSVTLPSG
ncbi:hypothetical protein Barb6XT_02910 [Bacteroidales bacterium Barb6XT]|nr:hypothetical protein Barb6XT_02910 [Bacteroidales bacterium Barb6XT]